MKILEFPVERTPAGKVAKVTRQVELLLQQKCVTNLLLDHLGRLAAARRELAKPQRYFRRDQVAAFNVDRKT